MFLKRPSSAARSTNTCATRQGYSCRVSERQKTTVVGLPKRGRLRAILNPRRGRSAPARRKRIPGKIGAANLRPSHCWAIEAASAASPPLPENITDGEIPAGLAAVPQDFRAVVLLIDVEEFSYKEAAGILNVPIWTVMSRWSRGRRLLREMLADVAQSYGLGHKQEEGRSA
jgi:DNA-directed RNA polymerase specialized sigma24 family protein